MRSCSVLYLFSTFRFLLNEASTAAAVEAGAGRNVGSRGFPLNWSLQSCKLGREGVRNGGVVLAWQAGEALQSARPGLGDGEYRAVVSVWTFPNTEVCS